MSTRHVVVHECSQGSTSLSYIQPYGSAWSTTNTPMRCTYQLKTKQIGVILTTAPGATRSWTFDLLKNGSATGITFSIANTDTTGFIDLPAGVSYNEDDTLVLRRTAVNTPTLSGQMQIVWLWDMQHNNQSSYFAFWAPNTTQTFYYTPVGFRFGSTSNIPVPCPIAGTLTKAKYNATVAPGAGTNYVITLFKNGTAQDGGGGTPDTRVTIADAATTGEWSGTLTVSAGDTLAARIVPTNTPAGTSLGVGIGFTPTVDGETMATSGTNQNMPTSAGTTFNTLSIQNNLSQNATETAVDNVIAGSGITFKVNKFFTSTNGSAFSNAGTFTVRKNTADTAIAATVAASGTSASDVAHEATFSSGDTWSLQLVMTGSAGVARQQYGSIGMFAQVVSGKGAGGKGRGSGGNQFVPSGAASYIVGNPGVDIGSGG